MMMRTYRAPVSLRKLERELEKAKARRRKYRQACGVMLTLTALTGGGGAYSCVLAANVHVAFVVLAGLLITGFFCAVTACIMLIANDSVDFNESVRQARWDIEDHQDAMMEQLMSE